MKVIANWKMHGFKDDYLHWYKNLSKTADENLFDDLGIAPPFTLLDECKTHQSKIKLGAQNISHLPEGPVTGEISACLVGSEMCIRDRYRRWNNSCFKNNLFITITRKDPI